MIFGKKPEPVPEATYTHTCVHENNWRSAKESVQELQETIKLLLALEPGLDKYQRENNWGHRVWDTEGMKAALEFRRLQEASTKYEAPVVSETTTTKRNE